MLALFFAAYILVTILAAATTEIYGSISKPPPAAPGVSPVKAPVFLATVPYHVLIMLVVWTIFALIYLKRPEVKMPLKKDQKPGTWLLHGLHWPYSLTSWVLY
jgi:preprotein translocase subunit SecY